MLNENPHGSIPGPTCRNTHALQRQGLQAGGGCTKALALCKPQLGWQKPRGRTITPPPVSQPGIWVLLVPKIPPKQRGGRLPLSVLTCPPVPPTSLPQPGAYWGWVAAPGWAPPRPCPSQEGKTLPSAGQRTLKPTWSLLNCLKTPTTNLLTITIIITGDFPGGPVAKTLCSQCRGCRFHPWSGN